MDVCAWSEWLYAMDPLKVNGNGVKRYKQTDKEKSMMGSKVADLPQRHWVSVLLSACRVETGDSNSEELILQNVKGFMYLVCPK